MFDQNWLKRYMLANRPKGATDEHGGAGVGGGASRQVPAPRVSIEEPSDLGVKKKPKEKTKDLTLDREYPVSVVDRPDMMQSMENPPPTSLLAPLTPHTHTPPQTHTPPHTSHTEPHTSHLTPHTSHTHSHPATSHSHPGTHTELHTSHLTPHTHTPPQTHTPPHTSHTEPHTHATPHTHTHTPSNPFTHHHPPLTTHHQPPATTHPRSNSARGEGEVKDHNGHTASPRIAGTAPATSSDGMIPSPSPHASYPAASTSILPTVTYSRTYSPAQGTQLPQGYMSSPQQVPTMVGSYSPSHGTPQVYQSPPQQVYSSPIISGYNPVGGNYAEGFNGGFRNYAVMCKDDVEVRAGPTYADDSRTGQFLHPGQVVACNERRMVNGAWFLRLADGRGWAFETKERLLVMTQAHDFERGLWHYSIVCEDDVETRSSPTYSDEARTGICLGPGDCMAVDERCRVAGVLFIKLADGRGWIFESKDRLLVASEVRNKPAEARDFERGIWHYTVVCNDDVEIRAAPTYSDEARCGLMLRPGDCIAIDERCRQGGTWFLRLADGRGWVFETKDSHTVCVQMR